MFSTFAHCIAPIKYTKEGVPKHAPSFSKGEPIPREVYRLIGHMTAKVLDVVTALSLLLVGFLGYQFGFGFSSQIQLLMAGVGGGLLTKEILGFIILYKKESKEGPKRS